MKWVKRIVIAVGLLAVMAALAGVLIYHFGVRGVPAWYQQHKIDPETLAAAARRATNKVAATINWASESQAYQDGQRSTGATQPDGAAATVNQPPKPFKLTFTEEELNAFLADWTQDLQQKYSDVLKDPVVALHDGRLILAAQMQDAGTVMSVHFKPVVDVEKSELWLTVDRVLAGNLPLPESLFDKYRARLSKKLQKALPNMQAQARFHPDGTANADAVQAGLSKLLLHMLNREAASPMLFLPVPGKGSVPVKLTAAMVANKSLDLMIELPSTEEREALLKSIRTPYRPASAESSGESGGEASVPTKTTTSMREPAEPEPIARNLHPAPAKSARTSG